MATEIELKARTLIWEDSESNFESENHVFKKGEEVIILDPLRRKIGNGVSTFNELQFDTKHNVISLGSNASTVTIYNAISQTVFSYERTSAGPTDVIFLLDSYKDTNRGFSQCDGRMHKIFIENGDSYDFEVEVGLTSLEIASGSKIIDIGNVIVPASSSIVIEFCWFYDVGNAKVCYSRIVQSQNSAPASTSSIWTDINATRTGVNTFTMDGNYSASILYKRGLVIKWQDDTGMRCGMIVSSSYASNVTTFTIVGDSLAASAVDFRYTHISIQVAKFVVAGIIGASGTNVANIFKPEEPVRLIGATLYVNAAGTTGNTIVNFQMNGSNLFTTAPYLASTQSYSLPFSPISGTLITENDIVSMNLITPQTTPCSDLYANLLIFPQRLLFLN
ncbi:MAG: hypothetical protein CVU04_04005 [Bacteroidetes bacterium HGW-Bacteroidetes-20]|nr:MAG: hypothetical protein CVU04_04005 [Bacteroidetes bacterium HGW-Bacteroidetes-20]